MLNIKGFRKLGIVGIGLALVAQANPTTVGALVVIVCVYIAANALQNMVLGNIDRLRASESDRLERARIENLQWQVEKAEYYGKKAKGKATFEELF